MFLIILSTKSDYFSKSFKCLVFIRGWNVFSASYELKFYVQIDECQFSEQLKCFTLYSSFYIRH